MALIACPFLWLGYSTWRHAGALQLSCCCMTASHSQIGLQLETPAPVATPPSGAGPSLPWNRSRSPGAGASFSRSLL